MVHRCRKSRRAAGLRRRKVITAIPAFHRIRSKVTEMLAPRSDRRPDAAILARAWIEALQPRAAWEKFRPRTLFGRPGGPPLPTRRTWHAVVLLVAAFLAAGCYELRTSLVQSYLLSLVAGKLSYGVQTGPSTSIVYPKWGPFDERRGYTRLPDFRTRLEMRGFRTTRQARFSTPLALLAKWGVPPPYHEPPAAGLLIHGMAGDTLYDATLRDRIFRRYEDVPPVLVKSLLYVENRALREPPDPHTNPTVDWPRFAKAGWLYAGRKIGLPLHVEGGSTLAVQLKK